MFIKDSIDMGLAKQLITRSGDLPPLESLPKKKGTKPLWDMNRSMLTTSCDNIYYRYIDSVGTPYAG